jgi:hypothetical protein
LQPPLTIQKYSEIIRSIFTVEKQDFSGRINCSLKEGQSPEAAITPPVEARAMCFNTPSFLAKDLPVLQQWAGAKTGSVL